MSEKRIGLMVGLFLFIALFLFVSLRPVQASGTTKAGAKSLLFQAKNSRANQRAKVSMSKRFLVMGVPKGAKSLPERKERGERELSPKGFQWGQSCLEEEKTFRDRREAEKYLECLLEERKVLEGDFYGLNLTAYRYVSIFYLQGYIRKKIFNIDKEIKRTKSALHNIEK